jgi:hypothetical protein
MFTRRLGIVGSVGAVVLLATQVAHATGTGSNAGVAGVVVNTVTVGGVTFAGTCDYALTSRLTITGSATAVSTTPVQATSITCSVEHGPVVPATVSSSGWTAGPAAVTASTGQLQVRGTAICIMMSARASDGAETTTGPFCAS